jgi:hypothetical protein
LIPVSLFTGGTRNFLCLFRIAIRCYNQQKKRDIRNPFMEATGFKKTKNLFARSDRRPKREKLFGKNGLLRGS